MNIRLQRRRRAGIAAIELLMNLPILAALFMLLLTVSAAGLATFQTVLDARNAAWSHRNAVAPSARLAVDVPNRLTTVLRRESAINVAAGKISADAEGRLEYGYEPIVEKLPTINRRHALFAGAWDGEAIAFDAEPEHKWLTLDSRFENFGLSRNDRMKFRKLVP